MLEQFSKQQERTRKLQKIATIIGGIIIALGIIGYLGYFFSGAELKDISRDLVTKVMKDNGTPLKCVKVIDIEGKAWFCKGATATAVFDDGSSVKINIKQRLADDRRETKVTIIEE